MVCSVEYKMYHTTHIHSHTFGFKHTTWFQFYNYFMLLLPDKDFSETHQ